VPTTSDTRYAKSGDVNIAYQVVGEGPVDLVCVPGWVSHVELAWELPDLAAGFERLASFSRVILFDKRGTGMSDPVPADELPTLEQRMDDVRAVMDAVGSERAAIFGASEGREFDRVERHGAQKNRDKALLRWVFHRASTWSTQRLPSTVHER
jgi:pimeloyl-ACP methyl ester carboxylesterase